MSKLPVALFVLAVTIIPACSGRATTHSLIVNGGCWELGVTLQVSSLVTTPTPRQLEVSWFNARPRSGDLVGLYAQDPAVGLTVPLFQVEVTSESGQGLSNIQAPSIPSDDLGYSPHCLGYWAAYVSQGDVLASDCLRTLPTWMHELRPQLGGMQLKGMFLPGTHNSASYKKYSGSGGEDIFTKYTFTQEEDVLGQLVYGIRYVDIRIGYYNLLADHWWTFHGQRTHPLKEVLQQFKTFVDNTDEIVILDIQEFHGFGDGMEIHNKLVEYLGQELGDYFAPPALTWEATLNDVWTSGRRLIVTYDDSRVSSGSATFWQSVVHRWGNVQTLDDLYKYLSEAIITPTAGRPDALMAELTATALGTITDELGGLRNMADTVNRNVTLWFRGAWGETVNVVAADFFRGTAIIEESIAWNLRRAAHTPCGPQPKLVGPTTTTTRHT